MKLRINKTGEFIPLKSTVIYQDKTELWGNDVKEKLTEYILDASVDEAEITVDETVSENTEICKKGFSLYEDDEKTLIKDCNDQLYKWNIYTEYENGICLTNSLTDRECKPNPNAEPPQEIVDPLTNEELTECIADLIYDTSVMQLGLEV